MKHKLLKTLVLLVLLGTGTAFAQSTVSITNKTNGTTTEYTVQSTGSISFAGDYVVIKETSTASPQSIPLSSIRKMTFANGSAVINDVDFTGKPLLYPNPAQDYCVVRGVDEGIQRVTIYSMTGAKVIDTTVENEGRLDISTLQSGVYLAKVNNHTTKLIKW